jgi:predicted DCC family thiol-disulfide oxidoreductase YuxK
VDAAIVLYDRDCGFCRWSADRIRAWDRHGGLTFTAIQDPDATAWLAGMDRAAMSGSWHLVERGGRVWSAGAATPHLLARLPGGRPLAALARTFPGVTDRAYAFVSRHRSHLGRLLGQRACSVDPSAR